jgi:kumamolisin
MKFNRYLLAAAVSAACVQGAGAAPYPTTVTPPAQDAGPADAVVNAPPVTVTVALKLSNTARLAALLQSLYTPGNSTYRKFLTTAQFAAEFAPSPTTLAQVTKALQSAGLTVRQITTSHLQAMGNIEAIEAAFGVKLESFVVAATDKAPQYNYYTPMSPPQLPAAIADSVEAVLGLDTRPRYTPHLQRAVAPAVTVTTVARSATNSVPALPDPFGFLTVLDFAAYYDVNPLYARGFTGKGQTVGIVTLASFTQSDAYAYWQSLGLKVAADRITEQPIDGGSGAPSDASGSIETSLDVEQSGGIAPAANIIVYEAPNTNQGLIDSFAAAIDENVATTVSCSWGEWEFLDSIPESGTVTVNGGKPTSFPQALNDLLMQAAVQGQSFSAASGDDGAFTSVASFPIPQYKNPLSVSDPAAQPYIMATGGTTLAGPQTYTLPSGAPFSLIVATEQAWGWDYLTGFCKAQDLDPIACGIYPIGSGGGVSTVFRIPTYQVGIAGMAVTEPGQELIDTSQTPPAVIAKLPAGFPGRNVPDLSVNADPQTGYTIYYTSDVSGFEILSGYGGTSFAAPQLSGVTSLLDDGLGSRLGLLNFPLYNMLRSGSAYSGTKAPLRDITDGDNWFYYSHAGYDQATGLGVPNVANLLEALENPLY